MYKFALITLLTFIYFFFPSVVEGQYYSQEVSKSQFVIDKRVRPITSSTFYDNIDASIKIFSDSEQIEFMLRVKNTGNTVLENTVVTDTLPEYLSLIFYPGKYDVSDKKIVFEVPSLNPGEAKDFLIRAKVTGVPTVSTNESDKIKLTNKVSAVASGLSDSDNSFFYVGRKQIPDTGSEGLVMSTVVSITVGALALALRRMARGY